MSDSNGHGPRTQLDRLRAMPGPRQALDGRRVMTAGAALVPTPAAAAAAGPRAHADAPGQLIPLTLGAVTAVLDDMEAKYFVDGDDAVGGIWENGYFYFFLLAEDGEAPVFQVYGQWERALPVEFYPQVAIFANEWNAERAWPKAFARALDDESIGLYGELTVDFGPAVTHDQLDRAVNAGLASSLALFNEATLTFPEAVPIEF
ncbi:YbjN domain-containing protein [Jiangella rhizosphaerae]|uniref:YbjN domain-containing protein n=1 Tax=Jiangella rhizosphaerae TaxID=2293569 RepID=A0A418KV17_9ACTN|nr:YbjN domain-containing protein [Jiangella rhizosphaerae]RIQ33618.1 YbjN domain-containing protein [Jiangella rhizosphaerae]